MKNKKILVAILALVLVGVIGGTVAYYTSTASFENKFTSGTYSTSIVEEFESPNNWTPGTTTNKKVNVTNVGSVEVAVRAKFTEKWTAADGTDLPITRDGERVALFAVDSNWIESTDGYYYYNDTLTTNETSSDFISSVTFNPNFKLKDGQDIQCTTTKEEGKTTVECVNLTSGYAGAKYNLAITIETIQADQKWSYKAAEMTYYKSTAEAIAAINNSTYDDNSTLTKGEATVALYTDDNNVKNLVLLEDTSLDTALEPSEDLIVKLSGNTLSLSGANGINVTSGDVVIDGTAEGSKVVLTNDTASTALAKVNNGSLTLNGGTYETTSNGAGTSTNPNASLLVESAGSLKINNATITATDTDGGTLAGVLVETGGNLTISDTTVEVTSLNGLKSSAIVNNGTATLTNINVSAYANYTANAAKTDYATSSSGITNEGTMTLKNSYVYGAHSGIRNVGTLYIDGGTYEGYGHGGIYFAGAGTTNYVRNATVQQSDMKVGYDDGVAGTNKAGFYIGGASNITVYMDNCTLYGYYYPAVLRKSGGESNNTLYISNSNASGHSKYFRNDASTSKNNKIYIGTGNNFATIDTYLEANTVETDVDYSTLFPVY